MIIIPRFRDVFVQAPCLGKFAGMYKLVGRKPDGRERLIADWFPNLITDQGLESLGTYSYATMTGTCEVGSGNTPPAVTDSNLVAKVASASSVPTSQRGKVIVGGAPPGTTQIYNTWKKTYRFNAGVAAGNLSELCVRRGVGLTMFSRALILDASGLPTTITVLSDEVLDVYYELRLYFDLADYPYSMVIQGVTYTGTARLCDYGGAQDNSWNTESWLPKDSYWGANGCYNGSIQGINTHPSGNYSGLPNPINQPYSANSKKGSSAFNIALTECNLTGGGWSAMRLGYAYGWTQFSVSPKVPKDNTKVMTLNAEFGPWGRYVP